MSTKTNYKKTLQPWLIWLIGSLFVPYQFLMQTTPSVMIPELMQALSIDIVQIGLLSSVLFYSYLSLQVPAGILVDRLGAKRMLLVAIVLCAGGSLLFSLANSFLLASFSRFLMGVASTVCIPAALYLACKWFPVERFALVVGFTEMLGMLGGVIGESFLGAAVHSTLGWRGTMQVCAYVGFVLAILVWLIVRDAPTEHVKHQVVPGKQHSFIKHLLAVITHGQVWLAGLSAGLIFAIIPGFAALWAVPFLQKVYSVNVVVAGMSSALIFLGAAVGTPLAGWLSDYWGKRRPIIFIGAAVALLSVLIILYMPYLSFSVMLLLLFVLGFACGIYVVPFAIVKELLPDEVKGAAMGFTNMLCVIIGAPLLQSSIGWLLNYNWDGTIVNSKAVFAISDYQAAFVVLPICLSLALLTTLFVRETYCRRLTNKESELQIDEQLLAERSHL